MYERRLLSLRINGATLDRADMIALKESGEDYPSRITRSEVIRAAIAVGLQYPDEIHNHIVRMKEQP